MEAGVEEVRLMAKALPAWHAASLTGDAMRSERGGESSIG